MEILFVIVIGYVAYKFFSRQPSAKKYYGTRRVSGKYIYSTKVVGVTFESKTGKDRQRLVKKLKIGDILYLIPERNNKHDSNAIIVLTQKEDDIGYLSSEEGKEMRKRINKGEKFFAQVDELRGGTDDYPTRGVVIGVFKVT